MLVQILLNRYIQKALLVIPPLCTLSCLQRQYISAFSEVGSASIFWLMTLGDSVSDKNHFSLIF